MDLPPFPYACYANGEGANQMAHPGLLVETIAAALGVPRETVVQHDRHLAARGYRRKGGRGRSAIHVTPEDAANLLIAVAAAPISGPVVTKTINTFERYARLPAWQPSSIEPGDWSELKVLSELRKGHSLSEALAALIRGYANGDFATPDLVWSSFSKPVTGDHGYVEVDVKFEGPVPSAEISIEGRRGLEVHEAASAVLSYHEKFPTTQREVEKLKRLRHQRGEDGDLIQIRIFSDATLKAIAGLFSENGNLETQP